MTPELTVETTAAATLAGQEGAMNYDTAARDDAARAGAIAVLRGDGAQAASALQEGAVNSEHGKPVTLDRLRRIHAPGPVRVAEGEWRERLRLRESADLAMGVGR